MRLAGISLVMLLFGGVLIGGASKAAAKENVSKFKATESIEQHSCNCNRLEVRNKVGYIQVKPSKSILLKSVVEKVLHNGTAELADELFAAVQINVRINGATVLIEASGLENKDAILQKYQTEIDIAKVSFEINYQLEVPENFSAIDLETDVGEIATSNLTGCFDLNVGVGNIDFTDNILLNGKSQLLTGVGNINLRQKILKPGVAMNVEAKNGNINLTLAKNVCCTLEIEQFMKDKEIKVINGGGVKIKAKGSLGNVNVNYL